MAQKLCSQLYFLHKMLTLPCMFLGGSCNHMKPRLVLVGLVQWCHLEEHNECPRWFDAHYAALLAAQGFLKGSGIAELPCLQ